MAALTGDAPLPPAATRLLSLAWNCLERASADTERLPSPLRARVRAGLELVTPLLTPRGVPAAFGALPGSLAPTPRGEGEEEENEVSYSPSHDSRPSPARRRLLEEQEAAARAGSAAAAGASARTAGADAGASSSSSPAPRRPSSAARFRALFTPPKGAKAAAPATAAAVAAPAAAAAAAPAAAPSSPAPPKRPSSAQRLKAAFSPKQKQQQKSSSAIEVSASAAASVVAVPPLLSSHPLPASLAAEAEKPKRPSSAQRLKAAFSPKKAGAAGGGLSVAAESPSAKQQQRPSSAARLRAALKIGSSKGSTPGKGGVEGNASTINLVASSPARPAYVPGSIAAQLASPSQRPRFEF